MPTKDVGLPAPWTRVGGTVSNTPRSAIQPERTHGLSLPWGRWDRRGVDRRRALGLGSGPEQRYAEERRQQSGGRRAARPDVSVVIPAKEEAANIGWVVGRIPDFVHDVVVVDSSLTSETAAVAQRVRPDVRIVREHRPGKGAALRAGFAAARGDFVVMIDADGSMDPGEIGLYLDRLEDRRAFRHGRPRAGDCDLVKGSRFVRQGGTADMEALRALGNRALLMAVNRLYGARFSDLCYGFVAFRRDKLDVLDVQSDGFEIESEIVIRAIKGGLRIGEVPSFEAARRNGQSNLRTFRDGWRVLQTVMRERFRADGDTDALPEPVQEVSGSSNGHVSSNGQAPGPLVPIPVNGNGHLHSGNGNGYVNVNVSGNGNGNGNGHRPSSEVLLHNEEVS
jgi:hypothetical protein